MASNVAASAAEIEVITLSSSSDDDDADDESVIFVEEIPNNGFPPGVNPIIEVVEINEAEVELFTRLDNGDPLPFATEETEANRPINTGRRGSVSALPVVGTAGFPRRRRTRRYSDAGNRQRNTEASPVVSDAEEEVASIDRQHLGASEESNINNQISGLSEQSNSLDNQISGPSEESSIDNQISGPSEPNRNLQLTSSSSSDLTLNTSFESYLSEVPVATDGDGGASSSNHEPVQKKRRKRSHSAAAAMQANQRADPSNRDAALFVSTINFANGVSKYGRRIKPKSGIIIANAAPEPEAEEMPLSQSVTKSRKRKSSSIADSANTSISSENDISSGSSSNLDGPAQIGPNGTPIKKPRGRPRLPSTKHRFKCIWNNNAQHQVSDTAASDTTPASGPCDFTALQRINVVSHIRKAHFGTAITVKEQKATGRYDPQSVDDFVEPISSGDDVIVAQEFGSQP